MSVLAGLEPAGVWDRFAELTRIAAAAEAGGAGSRARSRLGSGARLRDGGRTTRATSSCAFPASDGREGAPTVVLQAHLDMVCERDPDSPYDPREGRIDVVRDGDWVVAEGTTLGADNGIGVAAAMAVAEDSEIAHGPLELLFTVSEEQGLDGAKALDPSLVTGRLLLNLDGTSDKSITIGCAGSTHTFTRLRARARAGAGRLRDARSDGLRRSRRPLGRRHRQGPRQRDQGARPGSFRRTTGAFRLARLEGGVSQNALPRDARALVAFARRRGRCSARAAERELAAVREQYAGSDDGLPLSIEPADAREARRRRRRAAARSICWRRSRAASLR